MAEGEEVMQSEDKLVKTLSLRAFEALRILLRPRSPGKDWRSLADLMGFTLQEIFDFQEERDPVTEILVKWISLRNEEATTNKLTLFLKQLGRLDVINEMQCYFDEAPTIAEYKRKEAERKINAPLIDENEPVTLDESYDVFISYAAPDVSFAKEILRTLEEKYDIKACINFRDFLPGPHPLEQIVEVIENRCRRVVAILSEDYAKCQDCDYQAKVAMTLSPGGKRRILLPVLYKECQVPPIMKGIYFLNYADDDCRENFWEKLSKAINGKKK